MKSTRGSAAIMAIVFMMLLLIVGIGFIPMISTEVRSAKMDEDEQKAWYAAEAGKKYIEVFAKDQEQILIARARTTKIDNSSDKEIKANFTISFADMETKTRILSDAVFPVAGKKYIAYSVGEFNGIKKVITTEWTAPTNVTTTPTTPTEPTTPTTPTDPSSGGESVSFDGIINSGGTVTINDWGGTFVGNIYAKSVKDNRWNSPAQTDNWKKGESLEIKTKIPNSVFNISNYANLVSVTIPAEWASINLISNTNYLWNIGSESQKPSINASDKDLVFIHSDNTINFDNKVQLINGYTSKINPLILIFDNDVVINGNINNNVKIISKGKVTINSAYFNIKGLLMIIANGDIEINTAITNGSIAFLSSNGNIKINQPFTGQIQAKGDVTLTTQSTYYNFFSLINDSNSAFSMPVGME